MPLLMHQERLTYQLKLLWNGLKGAVKPIIKHPKQPIIIKQDEVSVWMIGHASVLINFFGTTILTDPVLVTWLPFPRRITDAGYKASELPEIDYILISHAHLDHLNTRSLRRLVHKTKTIVLPKNCSDLVEEIGFRKVVEMDWESKLQLKELTLYSFKSIHWGERYPWQRRKRAYNAYLLQKNGKSIFFCGDSAYGELFKRVGSQFRTDLALLPIGAYSPATLRKVHMDPFDAMQAFYDLGANYMIPIHWGNFRISLESPDEPPRIMDRITQLTNSEDLVYMLKNGESITL
ncbi:MAG: MBL fold metallo-hydrolase [bacterium]|nr:MBL fold metallo-hydrolase [bacterium]